MAITLNGTTGITTPDVDSTDLTATGNFTSRGIDDNATSTAMTLDSSGNLLVGTTSSFGSSGITLGSNKVIYAAASSQNVANFQRYTTDGEIVRFGKDGSTVGSIASRAGTSINVNSQSGDLYLQRGGTTGLIVNPTYLTPGADATATLGGSWARFTDLYLSGGVYLGGTGSANHLDDYEEGAWTPSFSEGITSLTYSIQKGRYTKVGRFVACEFYILCNGTGTGAGIGIQGLPFAIASGDAFVQGGGLSTYEDITNNTVQLYGVNGATKFTGYINGSTGYSTSSAFTNKYIIGTFQYITA